MNEQNVQAPMPTEETKEVVNESSATVTERAAKDTSDGVAEEPVPEEGSALVVNDELVD